ncbi:MAG: glycosyl hydrolase 108 family protein, partial [Bacteroidales bacterium]|nr:glycosyl hydrolase 108 family protein [Bacteroidales bacterium]
FLIPKLISMSSFELFAANLFPLEGGFSDDPNDRGGATNRGVTFRNIIRNDPTQKRFEKGWMNRVNEFI